MSLHFSLSWVGSLLLTSLTLPSLLLVVVCVAFLFARLNKSILLCRLNVCEWRLWCVCFSVVACWCVHWRALSTRRSIDQTIEHVWNTILHVYVCARMCERELSIL